MATKRLMHNSPWLIQGKGSWIRNGSALIEDGKIAAVGPADEMAAAHHRRRGRRLLGSDPHAWASPTATTTSTRFCAVASARTPERRVGSSRRSTR